MLRDAVAALEDAHLAREFGYVTFGSQDDQDRRLSLRYNTVLNIKNKQPNKDHFAAMPKLQRKDGMPQTPPCDDLSIPSRKWKYDTRQWDLQLKHWQKDQKEVPILPLNLAALIAWPHFCMWPHIVATQQGRFFRLSLVNDLNEQTNHAFSHAF